MIELIGTIIALATFSIIAYPLIFRKPLPEPSSGDDDRLQELYSKRNTTYSMIKELEFDFNSGILTEEDYKDLESDYKSKAISILKGIDEHVSTSDNMEDEIEKQVQELRQGKIATDVDAEIERQVRKLRKNKTTQIDAGLERQVGQLRSRGQFCPQCGMNVQERDRFCRHCGANLD